MLLPTQTRTLNIQVQKTAPCPGTNTIWLSTFTSNLIACCSTKLTLPTNRCIILKDPYDFTVVLTNTMVALRAIPNPNPVPVGPPCPPFGIVRFYADSALVALRDLPPYEAAFTPTSPGMYEITAVVTLGTGEVETSDASHLQVIALGAPHDQDPHPHPGPLSASLSSGTVSLSLHTDAGKHYTIEYNTNLAGGEWKTLQNVDGDGSIKVITDAVTNDPARFYRSKIVP
jgi:hypothetical protein